MIAISLSVGLVAHFLREEIHNIEIRTSAKILSVKIRETLDLINSLESPQRTLIRGHLKRENIFYITGSTPYFFPAIVPVVKNEDLRLGVLEVIDSLNEFRIVVAGQSQVNNIAEINNNSPPIDLVGIVVELNDGSFVWIGVEEKLFAPKNVIPLFMPILIISLPLLIIIILTLFWVLRPLRQLTLAAQTIGGSIHTTPKLPQSNLKEIKVASDALKEMHDKLKIQFNRLVITLGALSHDLRTPLQRLHLRAGLLSDPVESENIHRDIEELQKRVEDGLYYLRVSGNDINDQIDLPKTNINLVEKIRNLVADYQSTNLFVKFDYDIKLNWQIVVHWTSLSRALGNVIDNGLYYGSRVEISLEQTSKKVTINIRDFGKGIPPEQIEKAMTPFVRLEESRTQNENNNEQHNSAKTIGSSGLGLAIAKAIINQHGGEIILKNHTDGGLIVKFILPK